MAKRNKPKRNPNIPVLAFKIETTEYHILVAGSKECISMACNGHKSSWSPESLIVRRYDQGLREEENHLHSASLWGWFGRLMSDPEVAGKVKMMTPTDKDYTDYIHTLDEDRAAFEKARNYEGIYQTAKFKDLPWASMAAMEPYTPPKRKKAAKKQSDDPGVFGTCATCGEPNDVNGCTKDRSHVATII